MQGDFVIQLRPSKDPAAGQLEGRVEHIDSGRSAHFHNVEELLAFLAAQVAQNAAPSSAERITAV
jgi:hypothetical protein